MRRASSGRMPPAVIFFTQSGWRVPDTKLAGLQSVPDPLFSFRGLTSAFGVSEVWGHEFPSEIRQAKAPACALIFPDHPIAGGFLPPVLRKRRSPTPFFINWQLRDPHNTCQFHVNLR